MRWWHEYPEFRGPAIGAVLLLSFMVATMFGVDSCKKDCQQRRCSDGLHPRWLDGHCYCVGESTMDTDDHIQE